MVNYRGLKAKPEQLLAFLQSMAKLDHQVYEQWEDKEKIAIWINAYNALTLKAIIDHYPIKRRSCRLPGSFSLPTVSGKFQVFGTVFALP